MINIVKIQINPTLILQCRNFMKCFLHFFHKCICFLLFKIAPMNNFITMITLSMYKCLFFVESWNFYTFKIKCWQLYQQKWCCPSSRFFPQLLSQLSQLQNISFNTFFSSRINLISTAEYIYSFSLPSHPILISIFADIIIIIMQLSFNINQLLKQTNKDKNSYDAAFVNLEKDIGMESYERSKGLTNLFKNDDVKDRKNAFIRAKNKIKDEQLQLTEDKIYRAKYQAWKQQQTIKKDLWNKKDLQTKYLRVSSQNITNQAKRTLLKNRQKDKQYFNNQLSSIKRQYDKKLHDIMQKYQSNIILSVQKQQFLDELKVQSIKLPSNKNEIGIMTIDQKQQFRNKQQEQKKKIVFENSSYQNLIRRPPPKSLKPIQQPPIYTITYQQPQEPQITLDINKILQLPYRKFLLFFQKNIKMIARLTSIQEMSRLIDYRDEALEKANAIELLRQKIDRTDEQTLKRLSPQRRDKLFKILYEQ